MKTRSLRALVIGVFVYWIVAYGSIQLIFGYDGEIETATQILITTLFSAVLFSGAIWGALNVWRLRNGYDGIPTADQSADITVNATAEATARSIVAELERMKAKSIKVAGTSPVLITASTRMTWKSFGENLSVAVTPADQGRSAVHIETRPKISMTLVDYGKGLENVRQLSESVVRSGTEAVQ